MPDDISLSLPSKYTLYEKVADLQPHAPILSLIFHLVLSSSKLSLLLTVILFTSMQLLSELSSITLFAALHEVENIPVFITRKTKKSLFFSATINVYP